MTLEEKEMYLLKPTYTAKDIMAITGCKKSWATQIMKECKDRFNGSVLYRDYVITARSFWEREGTTLEEQYALLGIAKNATNNN